MSFISPYQDSGINKIIQAYSDGHDAVFCYGAGLYGKIVGAFLLENDISMEGYIVSDDVEPDMSVLGLPLYSAKEKLPKLKNNSGVIVAVNENLQSDNVSFLEKNNITDYLCIKNTWIPILRDSCDFNRRYESVNNITVICYHRVANIVFINAWNEWGEGMHLEPDEEHKYKYLEALRDAKQTTARLKGKFNDNSNDLEYEKLIALNGRTEMTLQVLNKWLTINEQGGDFGSYFKKKYASSTAIYGYGVLGRHLFRELVDSGVTISFVVDRNAELYNDCVRMVDSLDGINSIQNIIIASPYYEDEIRESLKDFDIKNIYSIDSLISDYLQEINKDL